MVVCAVAMGPAAFAGRVVDGVVIYRCSTSMRWIRLDRRLDRIVVFAMDDLPLGESTSRRSDR